MKTVGVGEFASWESIRSLGELSIGVPGQAHYYISLIQDYLPRANIVPVASPREFFTKSKKTLDAFVYSAEAGSAWTLVYPAFSVVVPLPDPVAVPLAYLMPRGDREMADYVNTWIELKHNDQTISKLFDHWILGKGAAEKEPRWSVIRNVLHWVD